MKCSQPAIVKATALAGSTVVLLAQCLGIDGSILSPDDVDSVAVHFLNLTDEDAAAIADDAPNASDVVVELTTDDRWTRDSAGYNVAYKTTAPAQDVTYSVRIVITTEAGDSIVVAYEITGK